MEKEDYIKKWLQGTLEDEEKRIFERTQEYRSLEKLSKSLTSFKAPEYDVQTEYQLLRARKSPKGRVIAFNWLKPLLKIAAVFLMIAGTYFLVFYDSPTVVETLAAEKTELKLPDSSFAALNAFSRISFYEKTWKKQRKVQLNGEAFFIVAKGSKFDVQTSAGIVSVLGTRFNVKNRKDYFEVVCFEGSVAVRSRQKAVKLSPNQMFRIMGGVITTENIALENIPAWRANESTFKSIPFLYVIQELERQYDVSITTRNVDVHQLFTGSFPHSNLSLALKSISIPLNLSYQLAEGKKIILTDEGN